MGRSGVHLLVLVLLMGLVVFVLKLSVESPEQDGLERLAYLVLGATLPEIGRAVKRIMDGVGGDGS